MNVRLKVAGTASALALLAAGTANAALLNGFNPLTNNTSVFISVVERDASNNVIRNLVVDTGLLTLQFFEGPLNWTTSEAQQGQILGFINSIGPGSTVRFNMGGALNDQSFSSDLYGFLTTGATVGPPFEDGFAALTTGVSNIDAYIANVNLGVFSPAGTVLSTNPAQPGWHNSFFWGNQVGGGVQPSNEILFGTDGQIQGWRVELEQFTIPNTVLQLVSSDLQTGRISVAPVPLPATVWLLASGAGLLAWRRRRALAA